MKNFGRSVACSIVLALLAAVSPVAGQTTEGAGKVLAATPPMGWNSWDSFGTAINETEVRENAEYMAEHLRAFGWQYVTVDEGWFVRNPTPQGDDETAKRSLDAYGRYVPATNRFPSAADGKGFAPLAAYVHSLGLKFGIHILQGIPRDAVTGNLPIAGASFRAADAANTAGICSWNPDNYDLKPTSAGQAYYNSIARLYAGWGVDLVKIDCIAARPYKGDEVRMFHDAIAKTGRPIVISLSPGEAPVERLPELARNSDQWRISDDVWDLWNAEAAYPQGVNNQFPRAAKWAETQGPGHWADADMLPLGYLGPEPGYGLPRQTKLTHEEQRSMLTLWAMMRSPLVLGGDLPRTDPWTLALITNRDVLAMDQHTSGNRCVSLSDEEAVWTANAGDGKGTYVALFNRTGVPREMHRGWADLGVPPPVGRVQDLWSGEMLAVAPTGVDAFVAAHGVLLILSSAASH